VKRESDPLLKSKLTADKCGLDLEQMLERFSHRRSSAAMKYKTNREKVLLLLSLNLRLSAFICD